MDVASKNSRINARRERVLAKLQKKDESEVQAQPVEEDDKHAQSKAQIKQSRDAVDRAEENAYDTVDSIRVQRMEGEGSRRALEKKQREERLERVKKELEFSITANKDIEARWSDVAEIDVAQDLYQAIGEQYQRSSTLLQNKDNVIRLLQRELKEKDEEYVAILAQQQEDMITLMSRMREQFHEHVRTCEEQLSLIESAFVQERDVVVESNMAQIKQLFEQRTDMEQRILADMHERETRFQQELMRIRQLDADDHTSLKATLENNVQLLEQQLQQMRATYQLNSERLDYNYTILEERDGENKVKLETLRQKTLKMRLQLAAAVSKYHKEKAKFAQVDAQLSKEYERVMTRYQDLQTKQRHFAKADASKLQEVWELNEEKALVMAKKVLVADKLIHEQILRVPWVCPVRLASTDAPAADIDAITIQDVTHTYREQDNGYIQALTKKLLGDDDATVDGTGTTDNTTENNENAPPKETHDAEHSRAAHMKSVLRLIAREGVFLLDNKAQERIAAASDREKELYTADSVLQTIGVRDSEDLEELMELFHDESGGTKHPNDVMKTLMDFMNVRQRLGLSVDPKNDDSKNQKTVEMGAVKRLRKVERERRLWMRLGNILGNGRLRLWEVINQNLRKYQQVLEERARLVNDTTALAKQNQELKVLLQEYFNNSINTELQVPPTMMVRVNNPSNDVTMRSK